MRENLCLATSARARARRIRGGEAALEHEGVEAAFAQDVGGGGASASGIAADDVLDVLVECVDLQADEVQRDVDRIVDAKVLELARQAHVQPLAALGDD